MSADLGSNKQADTQWVPISDLMSVLMMIFLFIAIVYMRHVQQGKNKIEQIAVTYSKLQGSLYEDLKNEFRNDLKKWNATIDSQSLAIRFNEPDILFGQGQSSLKPEFRVVLKDFFPRYLGIILNDKYKDDIEEVRIEGHTSSEWSHGMSDDYSYYMNMELSQNRTRSVLQYVTQLVPNPQNRKWLQQKMTANGLSSSKPIIVDGKERFDLSRRVEFRVRTNAESRIVKILEETR